ncbi:TRAP transporter small permease subunit [candidate division KSB3 bacterium]|uniref:TRAP transporter small permease subunit n=1 Tax=candidate division KSB3 bacterium TaxID=2044937 RepID=A0A9D5Q4S6_9BACT|nr:TRAP transporter small permease subunit [candidate division KSB3 bacterium]MBD3323221.1 TRAP transporter small permease subunit [candidate division KSB3 bacterium]
MITKLAEKVAWVTGILVGIFAGVMCVVVTLEVVMRYLFHRSIFIADELSRLCFVWAGFLSVSLALRMGKHVSVQLLVNHLPQRLRRAIIVFSQTMILVFLIAVFWYGLTILPQQWRQLTPTMEIQMFWFYLPIPVGVGLMIIQLLPFIEHTLFHDPGRSEL